MDLINDLRASRDKWEIVNIEFLSRYTRESKVIYAFVEGKDDPCFYRGFLESKISDEWKVEIWAVNGKKNVLELFSRFDWKCFNKDQILFFVDRDLSNIIGESSSQEENLYITDGYAIENNIVNRCTCERVLREICGFDKIKYKDLEMILEVFDSQLELFKKALIPVMASIIYWRKNKCKENLSNIRLSKIFSIEKSKLSEKEDLNNQENKILYVHNKCGITEVNIDAISKYSIDFEEKGYYKNFTRGKFLFWFLVEFCLSIHDHFNSLEYVKIDKISKMSANLSHANGVVIIAPRARIPSSLESFLNKRIKSFINTKESA